MAIQKLTLLTTGLALTGLAAGTHPSSDQLAFEQADQALWQEVFNDPGTGNWTEKWFLDGEIGSVETSADGMQLTAGPQFKNDAHHIVLWTKESFEGDLKIEFEYTRLDFETRCVNILYIQASGSGTGPYAKDMAEWNELRRVPAMKMYFDHMNTYHVSYAAFGNSREDSQGYVRGRRYMPNRTGLKGTEMTPDYFPPENLFAPGVPHQFTVIKTEYDIYLRIKNPEMVYYCHLNNADLPGIEEGRIGLRHMFTRSACYKNFRISVPVCVAGSQTGEPTP